MNSEDNTYISVKNFYSHNKKSMKLLSKKYDNMNKLKEIEITHFMNALKVIMEIDEYAEQFSKNDIEVSNYFLYTFYVSDYTRDTTFVFLLPTFTFIIQN